MSRENTISVKDIYDGRIIKLSVHDVMLENGKSAERELIKHQGGVGVIPINEEGEIFLVKQFRKPYECDTLEIPAGKKERNEEPATCAERELREETGISAKELTFLADMYPSPGYTDEIVHIYKAEGLVYGEMSTDEDEFIEVLRYPLEAAVEMIRDGQIKDAKTVIAIMMTAYERAGQNHGQINK